MISSSESDSAHCSLCNDQLLRHLRGGGVCWFCPSCRQDMPNFPQDKLAAQRLQLDALATQVSEPAAELPKKTAQPCIALNDADNAGKEIATKDEKMMPLNSKRDYLTIN